MQRKVCFWSKPNTGSVNTPQKNKLIMLVGNPRSYTTVSVRVWAARNDGTKVINEPGVRAYNLQVSPPQQKPELTEGLFEWGIPTFEGVIDKITREVRQHNVFVKDTVFAAKHYLTSDFPGVDSDNTCFFFMLREPADTIVSNYRILQIAMDENLKDAWSYEDMLQLYTNLLKRNTKTYLIDSQTLLDEPETCVRQMCDRAGVAFVPECLSWDSLPEADRLTDDCRFVDQWQDTVRCSTGVDKTHGTKAKRNPDGCPTFEEIPEKHRAAYLEFYQQQLPFYQQLLAHYQTQLQQEKTSESSLTM